MTGNTIGFPCESVPGERRTLLTVPVASALTGAGFEVLAEPGIGTGVYLDDDILAAAGVRFTGSETVWSAPLVLRYKSPDPADVLRLRPGQSIAALFHAEGDPQLLAALISSGVTAYSYEFLREADGFPLAVAGGQIAGVQAVLHGALALQSHLGGRGVLVATVDGAEPARVVVIGSGNVGAAAARTAAALGARVTVLAHTEASAAAYRATAPAGVAVTVNTGEERKAVLADADLVIGALLVSTYDTPPMITTDDLAVMPPGAVIVDATCGYGPGYLPTAGPIQRPGAPPHITAGIGHLRLDALPSLVPVTTTAAYTGRIADYLVRLARVALHGDLDPVIDTARIAAEGKLVHPVCRQHAAFYTPSGADASAVVASYDQRAVYSRAETATVARPRRLPQLLDTCRHVAEIPCGSGHFLTEYAQSHVAVTVADANPVMLAAALDHAHTAGVPAERVTGLGGLLDALRLPGDVDLVVVPNGAINQLTCQSGLAAVAADLHAAIGRPGVQVVAQIAGPTAATGFFDPAQPDGIWVTDRHFAPAAEGAVIRRRRQFSTEARVRLELAYLDAQNRELHTATVDIALPTRAGILAAFTDAGFTHLRLKPGAGGFTELYALTTQARP
ncbi:NAD(P)-dependent oxidoreductase [Nocardia sp. NPDC003963]